MIEHIRSSLIKDGIKWWDDTIMCHYGYFNDDSLFGVKLRSYINYN